MLFKKIPFLGGEGVTLPPLKKFYLPRAILAKPGPLVLNFRSRNMPVSVKDE